jgi:hypothetical protein
MNIDFNEIFTYDNGKLFWRKKISDKCVIGEEAGWLNKVNKRHYVRVFGKSYLRSRIVYAIHNHILENQIDHINRICSDDRIENLRLVNARENALNKNISINRDLPSCVYYDPTNKKNPYYIRARVNGVKKIIGWAKTPEIANEIYKNYFKISI